MTRVKSGHCSQISINHVTFEIEAGISVSPMQTQQDFDTSLYVRNITDATVQNFCATDEGEDVDELGGTMFLKILRSD